MEKAVVSISIPIKILERLVRAAENDDCSVSHMVSVYVESGLNDRDDEFASRSATGHGDVK
jgi:hypothetical protein